MVGRLAPWRRPGPALAIWSHKLLRWATPWFIGIAGLSGWILGGWYLYVPAAVLAGAAIALAGHLAIGAGRQPPRVAAFARSIAVVNLAFALGWINVVRGRAIEVWHRAEFDPGR
jgi:hypothetical protein